MKYRTKTSKTLTAIMIVASFGLAAGTSVAEEGKGKRKFNQADVDGDGYISFEEFNLPRHRGKRADLDGDGQITRDEMNEHASARGDDIIERANERFSSMDLNGDDIVTEQEAREAAFTRLDRDQDGYLSQKEMKRLKRRFHKRQG